MLVSDKHGRKVSQNNIFVMVIGQDNIENPHKALPDCKKPYEWCNNEQESDQIHDFGFLYSYIRWFYFIGVVPFKPVLTFAKNEPPTVELERNVMQMILCGVTYIGGVTWSGIKLTHSYPPETLYGKPSRILAVVSVLFQLSYVLSFIYKFWLRPSHIKNLLNSRLQHTSNQHIKTAPTTVPGKFLLLVFACLPFLFTIVSSFIQFQTLRKTQPGCLQINRTESCSLVEALRYSYSFSLILTAELIYNCFQTFILLKAISGKWLTMECAFRSRVFALESKCICYLLERMDNLRNQFTAIRTMTSVFFLCFLCQLIPWTGYRLLDSMPIPGKNITTESPTDSQKPAIHDDHELLIKCYNWLVMFYYSLIIYYVVEAKQYADQFRDNLIMAIIKRDIKKANYIGNCQSVYHQSSTSHGSQTTFALSKYVEETMREISFTGGPFFYYSYKFVGTIFGIIVTLILFELQFGSKEQNRHINS